MDTHKDKIVQLTKYEHDDKDKQVILMAISDPTQSADYRIKRNMDTMMGVVRNK